MIERIDVENVLDEVGISLAIKGYKYLVDAVLLRSKVGEPISTMMILYEKIANKHNSTISRVERAIRHAWETHDIEIREYFNLKCKMCNSVIIEVIHREVLRRTGSEE